MAPILSFEQAPPISVPYRFFLTAPLFGVAAGVLLAVLAGDALQSRWTPATFALTHLITVGFMLQTMCGSLLQFVAVVAGANVWRPKLVAGVVHPALTLGGILLAAGFLSWQPLLIKVASMLLVGSILLLVGVLAVSMLRTPARGASIRVLRLALLGLFFTITLGAALTVKLGFFGNAQLALPLVELVNVHAAWGLGGWALMLVIGVSYMVVPMFQLTPNYPRWLTWTLPAALFAALCAWSVQGVVGLAKVPPAWQLGAGIGGAAVAACYAGTTLWLQSRRRRRHTDSTFLLWRGAMLSLIAFALAWVALEALPRFGQNARAQLLPAALALAGVFVSVITGMLYKIMPFLNWLHLQQRRGASDTKLPNVKQMISEGSMRRQTLVHFGATALLLGALAWPPLAVAAGLGFAVSFAWLQWNLVSATRVYVRYAGDSR